MNKKQKLDKLSSQFFFVGLFFNRFSRSKIPIFSSICFILSALAYCTGYIIWQASVNEVDRIAMRINPNLKAAYKSEFSHIRQYSYAAIIGIFASLSLLGAFFLPNILGIISSWLFLVSNCFWLVAENININRLRENKSGTKLLEAKEHYYDYSFFTTIISLVSTFSLTICLMYPVISIPLGILVSVNLFSLNINTIQSLIKSIYYTSKLPVNDTGINTFDIEGSYTKLSSRSDFTPNLTTQFEAHNIKVENQILQIQETISDSEDKVPMQKLYGNLASVLNCSTQIRII